MTKEMTTLSLGAGYQSTALALLLDIGGLPGYAKPECAVFADTQAEPPWVYATLDALDKVLSYPVLRTSFGDLAADTWDTIQGKATKHHPNQLPATEGKEARGFLDIPVYSPRGLFRRHCTQDYKIEAIKRAIRERFGWPLTLTQYMGISREEASRMRDARKKYITNVYPLAMSGWSRGDCVAYLEENWPDIPVGRSACYFCPFHSPSEWKVIADNAPDLFEEACRMEDAMATMPSGPYRLVRTGTLRKNMEEMRVQGKLDLSPTTPGDECSGHCFV